MQIKVKIKTEDTISTKNAHRNIAIMLEMKQDVHGMYLLGGVFIFTLFRIIFVPNGNIFYVTFVIGHSCKYFWIHSF